jgi:hypothetical protein
MRWPIKKKAKPEHNDMRLRQKFAWFPVTASGFWVWLERYWACEKYLFQRPFLGDGRYLTWLEVARSLRRDDLEND